MLKLNNDFLLEMGLGDMPDEHKKPFLKYIYEQLELRVGEIIAKGMTPDQINEFKKIAANDSVFSAKWLSENDPGFRTNNLFINILESTGYDEHDPRALINYVSARWLQLNKPDYSQIVANEISNIRREIIENRDKLI